MCLSIVLVSLCVYTHVSVLCETFYVILTAGTPGLEKQKI